MAPIVTQELADLESGVRVSGTELRIPEAAMAKYLTFPRAHPCRHAT